MFLQVSFLREGQVAIGVLAVVGLLPGVYPHMVVELILISHSESTSLSIPRVEALEKTVFLLH